MKNILIVLLTILSGLLFGYSVVHYPHIVEMVTWGIMLILLPVCAIFIYKIKDNRDDY